MRAWEACGPLANLPERQAAGGGKGLRADGGARGALRGGVSEVRGCRTGGVGGWVPGPDRQV